MTIVKGNDFDSRVNGRSYSMWTSGYDVCIQENGRKFFYHLNNYDHDCVTKIDPVMLDNPKVITWSELNENIKKAYFHAIRPNGTEAEMNLFVYGQVVGAKINAENDWVETHNVYSKDITKRLAKELGHFEKVQFLRTETRWRGTGYKNYLYVIDDKWLVTVNANNGFACNPYDSYKIEDYQKIVAQQKVFGRRVARFAKTAGVPWEVAVFVGYLEDDDEAVEILKAVRAARGTVSEDLQWELECGIGRRTAAISSILV